MVIVLQGRAHSGKTTTMNDLVTKFPSSCAITKNPLGKNPKDFFTVFVYKGRTIGICSVGDDNRGKPLLQEPILQSFINKKINNIICACRTKGQTKNLIDTLFSSAAQYVKMSKTPASMANDIFAMI